MVFEIFSKSNWREDELHNKYRYFVHLLALISENIKLYFFKKDGLMKNIEHQEKVISEIKERLFVLFDDVYREGKYEYVSEKRTYKPEDIVETLEELIQNDITTGEGDRANLREATSDNPSLEHFTRNHKLIRKANENRAVSKNKLDEQFENFIDENN